MAHTTTTGRVEGWSPAAFSRARLVAGISLTDLAQRVGASKSTVHSWSKNGRPMLHQLAHIARALRCAQRDLIGGGT